MKKHRLAFVDLETTGLDPFRHEIIEIGIVIAEPQGDLFGKQSLELLSEHTIGVKPEHIETAEPKALEINRYHKRSWDHALPPAEALRECARILNGSVFVAQNVTFDWTFLRMAAEHHGIDLERAVYYHKHDLGSMVFGKLYHDPDLFKFTLREMSTYFDVKNDDAHTALSDARATFEICKKLLAL